MRFYAEHVEHAIHRQLEDFTFPDGRVIKHAWPWAWGVLKHLKVGWIDLGDQLPADLLGEQRVRVETATGVFYIKVTGASSQPGKGVDYNLDSKPTESATPDAPPADGK
jgi:hypothetical protein